MKNKTILFVCTGNTCRSPMAELILKEKLKNGDIKNYKVKSAGLKATAGDKMSENSKKALKLLGVKVTNFRSKLCDAKLLLSSDYVICMTSAHKDKIKNFPNVFTFSEITGMGEVIDPYGQDLTVYQKTSHQIEDGCNEILKLILQGEL